MTTDFSKSFYIFLVKQVKTHLTCSESQANAMRARNVCCLYAWKLGLPMKLWLYVLQEIEKITVGNELTTMLAVINNNAPLWLVLLKQNICFPYPISSYHDCCLERWFLEHIKWNCFQIQSHCWFDCPYEIVVCNCEEWATEKKSTPPN